MTLVLLATYLIEVLVHHKLSVRWPEPTVGVLFAALAIVGPICLGRMRIALTRAAVRETAERFVPDERLLHGFKAEDGMIVLATDRRLLVAKRDRSDDTGEVRHEAGYRSLTSVAGEQPRVGESTRLCVTVTAGEKWFAIDLSNHWEARALLALVARRTELVVELPAAPARGTFLMRRIAWFSLLPFGYGVGPDLRRSLGRQA